MNVGVAVGTGAVGVAEGEGTAVTGSMMGVGVAVGTGTVRCGKGLAVTKGTGMMRG